MTSCTSIDLFITPYVDGELAAPDRALVDDHLRRCARCYSRVAAEAAVRELLHARKPSLTAEKASSALRARCVRAASVPISDTEAAAGAAAQSTGSIPFLARHRIAPLAVAATLVVIVGGAFLYQATHYSARLLAAELTADHVKCFAASRLFGTPDESAAVVETSMLSAFGWQLDVPERFDASSLELVGSRRCLYAEGRVAHLMYRDDQGRPISIFMLPKRSRPEELVEVLGHEAAIWSSGDRTFVLVTRGSPDEVQRMATVAKAALQ